MWPGGRDCARPRLGGGGGPFIALSPYNNWDAYANLALGGGVRVGTDSCKCTVGLESGGDL